MISYIDLNKSENIKLPYIPNSEFKDISNGKGWSFSYVYNFSELKDIYLAIKRIGYDNKNEFTKKCIAKLKIPYVSTPWDTDGRRILEQVNALKNFGLIDSNYKIIDLTIFDKSEIGEEITETDKVIFKNIYFTIVLKKLFHGF